MPIINKKDNRTREGSNPGLEVREIVDIWQGSQSLKIGEVTIATNTRIPRHIHTNTEEAMMVLEGKLDVVVGGQRMTVEAGDTILAPAGTTHGFVNRYGGPARILFVFPTHEPDRVLATVDGATSGFLSEAGLTGYVSPNDRPLENRVDRRELYGREEQGSGS
jgi:quercetin dioxygenase-like cupin family protein